MLRPAGKSATTWRDAKPAESRCAHRPFRTGRVTLLAVVVPPAPGFCPIMVVVFCTTGGPTTSCVSTTRASHSRQTTCFHFDKRARPFRDAARPVGPDPDSELPTRHRHLAGPRSLTRQVPPPSVTRWRRSAPPRCYAEQSDTEIDEAWQPPDCSKLAGQAKADSTNSSAHLPLYLGCRDRDGQGTFV